MSAIETTTLPEILAKHELDLLADWVREQGAGLGKDAGRLKESELREQCREFLELLQAASRDGRLDDFQAPRWDGIRAMLANLSRSRVLQGYKPSETANFVFSLKR